MIFLISTVENKELRTEHQHQLHCHQNYVKAKSYQHLIDYYDLLLWSIACFYSQGSSQDYDDDEGDEINGGRLAEPNAFPWYLIFKTHTR